MSGDDEKVEAETVDPASDASEDDMLEVDVETTRKPRFITGLLGLAGGLIIALGAGSVGGFAAHEYFKSPPTDIDLLEIEAKISKLETRVSAQAKKDAQLEAHVQKVSKGLNQDLKKFEKKWSQDLSTLEGLAESRPVEIETGVTHADTGSDTDTDDGVTQTVDIRPEMLKVIADIRRDLGQNISDITARVETLETAHDEAEVKPSEAVIHFPMESFKATLEGDAIPVEANSKLGKFLKKHVSVSRTGHADAVGLLQRIEQAAHAGDWDAAVSFSRDLPPEARSPVEEWIAATRR
ncbi:MAG: hypothetical protein ABJ275_09795 [Maricaulaceae bacterium]